MMSWWTDLSGRERTLIAIAGGLALVLAISFLVIRPVRGWMEDSKDRAAASRDGYELVATAAAVKQPEIRTAPNANVPLRQAITRSANQREILLVRIGAETGGQIEVTPDVISGEMLFSWLGELEQAYGVNVVFADIARTEKGLVNPQVLVFERAQ